MIIQHRELVIQQKKLQQEIKDSFHPQLDEFLEELTELTMKYGISISGCGCCGSPRLFKVSGKGRYTYSRISSDSAEELSYELE